MAFRYVAENALKVATVSGSAPATGYSRSALIDDHASILFRSSASGTAFEALFDRGAGSPSSVNLAAVVGLRGTTKGASVVTNVVVSSGPDGVLWPNILGTITVDSRGDGWCDLIPASTARWLKYAVTLSSADTLDWGDAWAGAKVDLTRDILGPYAWDEEFATVVNDADDRTEWTDQVADRLDDMVLAWDNLLAAEFAEVQTYFRAVRGRARAHLVIPDHLGAAVYLGHLATDRMPRLQDVPVVRSISLPFHAVGHYFYG